jgi:hypothetical protein
MKNLHRKKWVWILLIGVFILVSIQFFQPAFNNPPVTADLSAPSNIKEVFRSACYDCHSNGTKLSWYDKIAPANWLVAHDIREGRKVLNFSEWDKLSIDRQKGILFESLNHIQFNTMPLRQYAFMHPEANVDMQKIKLLQSYLSRLMPMPAFDTAKTNAWLRQYTKWINVEPTPGAIPSSPNGIAFMKGYKDWVAISSTDRSDDGRLRIITANGIAVNAIKNNRINPWPDGSAFAKIAWITTVDSSIDGYAGEFKQVAFMIKDKEKYRSTGGWGFAQWENGTDLVPHGNNLLFAQGCMNCHQPMKANDFVFTMPINLKIAPALEGKVICSFINSKEHTMSTLYGNDIAVNFARTHSGRDYPRGTTLSLVTWNQKEDIHWFGAKIPGAIKSVEKVIFGNEILANASPVYEKYEGTPLKKVPLVNLTVGNERLNLILRLHASVMP